MQKIISPIESTAPEKAFEAAVIALQLVPVVGGAIASSVEYVLAHRRSHRLNEFLTNLAADVIAVKERINHDTATSEEMVDVIEAMLIKAGDTVQTKKLDALRAVFLNTMLFARPNYDEAHEIINRISGWEPRHLMMLNILANPQEADRQMGSVVGQGSGFETTFSQILQKLLPAWSYNQIARTWEELCDKRILNVAPGNVGAMMTDQGIHHLENRLTEFGYRVVRYLTPPQV